MIKENNHLLGVKKIPSPSRFCRFFHHWDAHWIPVFYRDTGGRDRPTEETKLEATFDQSLNMPFYISIPICMHKGIFTK